jgi:hypothetical protein
MNAKSILFLVSLLLLFSCNKKEPVDIYNNLDRTQWFKYEVGDTLIFKSNASAINKYILEEISTYYIFPYNEYTHEEVFEVFYNGIQCNNCPISSFLRTPRSVRFYGDLYYLSYQAGDTIMEYELGDTTVYDVYVLEDIPTEDTTYFKVKALYYSHVYGYIRYDMYDDRVYELQLE